MDPIFVANNSSSSTASLLYYCWRPLPLLLLPNPDFLSSDAEPGKFSMPQPSRTVKKMLPLGHFFIPLATLLICLSLLSAAASNESEKSIYEVLEIYGLPVGLLPKGVSNFSFEKSGKFEVHLDQACYAKFESELRYDLNVTGTLSYGQINELSGISAQDLFLWFSVIEIRVDIPSSGLIYFDVGVVSKQYSLSSFETPRDCLAVSAPDLEETVSKILPAKIRLEHDQDNAAGMAIL